MNVGAMIFLASEAFKLIMQHLAARGSLNSLTQPQAEAMVAQLAAALPALLPTPEDLENPPAVPPVQ